ncbi:MAG: sensor histidine kinase [Silvibacterium sp.]|nr:sensor histidine kinase [Silvibacterium sp.]
MKRFVSHPPVPGPVVIDSKDGSADRLARKGRRSTPMLQPEGFDQLAHDARNVLSTLRLYCELLAEPGVLTAGNGHYAQELGAISDTASKLVERLSASRRAGLERGDKTAARRSSGWRPEVNSGETGATSAADLSGPWPMECVDDLGRELLEMRHLLAGIAGPRVQFEIAAMPCGGRSRLSREDFTRVMLNLVRNASEAMPEGGRVRITAQYGAGLSFLESGLIPDSCPRTVTITVEDSGPGIPKEIREDVFLPGFTTRQAAASWPDQPHRGLGLSIVRELVEAAGGTARVCPPAGRGARFELELPITSGMYEMANTTGLVADVAGEACIECP